MFHRQEDEYQYLRDNFIASKQLIRVLIKFYTFVQMVRDFGSKLCALVNVDGDSADESSRKLYDDVAKVISAPLPNLQELYKALVDYSLETSFSKVSYLSLFSQHLAICLCVLC